MGRNVSQRISFDDLKLFCKQAYLRVGVPDDDAEIVAGLLARSDLRGVETHGVMRLPIYIQRLQKGYVRAVCHMTLLGEKGGTAFFEAHGSMGHVVSYKAMEVAIKKALTNGIGWVSLKDSGHFGVAGLFAMMAMEKDFIGYVITNSAPMEAVDKKAQNPVYRPQPTLRRKKESHRNWMKSSRGF